MADLGDISGLLKEAAVSDLSWLDVDEKKYREMDQLPKQNLDIAPDLQAIWSHEDKPATTYFDKERPHTMGDLSEAHGNLRTSPEDIIRTARVAIMQSSDPARFKTAMQTRFDPESLRSARTALAGVLAERGLLGSYYIDASDFPGCHNSPKTQTEFVRKYASGARFIKAKDACGGCAHANRLPNGQSTCAVFHKELVVDVPFTDSLAGQVEQAQEAKGKAVTASSAGPKERIRLAMLAPDAQYAPAHTPKPVVDPSTYLKATVAPEPVVAKVDLSRQRDAAREAVTAALVAGRLTATEAQEGYRRIASAMVAEDIAGVLRSAQGVQATEKATYVGAGQTAIPAPVEVSPEMIETQLIAASNLTRKRDVEAQRAILARKAAPVVNLLRREMLKGRSASELAHALKLGFQSTDLAETRSIWEPIFRETGLYGHVYATQDSFDDCREGADFLSKHASTVRSIVAGEKCTGCIHNKMGRCAIYGKPLAEKTADVLTWSLVEDVLQGHKIAGRIPQWGGKTASAWGSTPADALKAIHRDAAVKAGPSVAAPDRQDVYTAFRGASSTHSTTSLTRRQVIRTASRYMNEGLYGEELLSVLKASFDSRDIIASKEDLRTVLAEQGLQGVYYVDPGVYDDYGKGCDEPSRLFRAKGVPYVKLGEKCASCVHQAKSGFCSKINKPLVTEPPYQDKWAQQRAVLASGKATEISYESLQNNGLTMLAEYQMQNGGMEVDVDPESKVMTADVYFTPTTKVKV